MRSVFCPNCGTSNEDSAARCKQCGFELQQAKPAAPKFKGTMLLGQSPVAGGVPGAGQPGAGQPAAASPGAGTSAPRPAGGMQPAARAPGGAAPRPGIKGTMVGVAPPAVGSAAPPQAGGAGGGPPRPALKGTMIGLAPPGIGSSAGPVPGVGPLPGGSQAAGAAQAGAPGSPQGPGPQAGPSKLKGTMIGVAPPSLGVQSAPVPDATAPTVTMASQAPQVPQSPGADAVNPLGGTVLGNPAPDFGAAAPEPAAPNLSATPPLADDAPGGGGYGLGALAATNPTGSGLADTIPPQAPEPAAPAQLSMTPATTGPQLAVSTTGTGTVGKERNPVATLLLGMLCFVYALVAMIQMLGELKAFRQKNDLTLLLFFIPIINIIEVLKLPEKVADAQRMAGIQNPQVAHPVLYLFFGLYFLAADLNEVWEAARRQST